MNHWTDDEIDRREAVKEAMARANAWAFYRSNNKVMSENQETIDMCILAAEVVRLRDELANDERDCFTENEYLLMRTRAETAEAALKVAEEDAGKLRVSLFLSEGEVKELTHTLDELRTPLKDWGRKLTEKNAALTKRNEEIATLTSILASGAACRGGSQPCMGCQDCGKFDAGIASLFTERS